MAPVRAIGRIGAAPHWSLAYLVNLALGFAALWLAWPVVAHVVAVEPLVAGRPPAEVGRILNFDLAVQLFNVVFTPLVVWLLAALLLTLASPPAKRPFPRALLVFFALNAYAWLPAAVGTLLQAILLRQHGPLAYHDAAEVTRALPDSLALLRPHGLPREIAFLGFWDVFNLWSLVLIGIGYSLLNDREPYVGLLLAFGFGLGLALMGALG
ncbi:MAG: hypothetical protein ACREM8_11490, partial [Vulcanimicrobiaceae bacterium]